MDIATLDAIVISGLVSAAICGPLGAMISSRKNSGWFFGFGFGFGFGLIGLLIVILVPKEPAPESAATASSAPSQQASTVAPGGGA